jgi:adenine-specific DNA-methyltransferase
VSGSGESVSDGLIERMRRVAGREIDPARKGALGQFMTPLPVARFMATLFERLDRRETRLLDAGAGVGSLTAAFLDRWIEHATPGSAATVTAYEIDPALRRHLGRTLGTYRSAAAAYGLLLTDEVRPEDFIEHGSEQLLPLGGGSRFTHAVLNPPYKKMSSASAHRQLLREAGIETVNLYSGFVALALGLLEDGGELVAIIPRSFCNGPYYRSFRDWMRERAALTHVHLFGSRREAFAEDEVLQENVIVRWVSGAPERDVLISWCEDATFAGLRRETRPFADVVSPDDGHGFIRIPIGGESRSGVTAGPADGSALFSTPLDHLGLKVSTGPVVDFRLRPHLRPDPVPGAVALLYPQHFASGGLRWPITGKKPNAIVVNGETDRWLFPLGRYVVTKRFTSKEEARRIVAHVVEAENLPGEKIGLENHLNVFHAGRAELDADLAHGLAVFLNSTMGDQHFRTFSGHTQINATDLRTMRYPPLPTLRAFGSWARAQGSFEQGDIDRCIERHAGARARPGTGM